jgi:hypothetical protein
MSAASNASSVLGGRAPQVSRILTSRVRFGFINTGTKKDGLFVYKYDAAQDHTTRKVSILRAWTDSSEGVLVYEHGPSRPRTSLCVGSVTVGAVRLRTADGTGPGAGPPNGPPRSVMSNSLKWKRWSTCVGSSPYLYGCKGLYQR